MSGLPYAPSPVEINMLPTYGALFIGCVGSAVLWGVNIVLAYQYYDYFRNDSKWMKLLIAWLLFLDALFSVTALQALFFWTVRYWGNANSINAIPWGWTALPLVVGPIVSTVQIYFAFRVYVLSKKENWWLPVIILLCGLAGMAFASANFGASVQLTEASELASASTSFIGWMAVATGADGLITGGMLYYLRSHGKESQFALTQNIMKTWTRLALETNLVTACGSFAAVFLFKWGGGFVFLATYFPTARVYFMSLLVAVNSRIRLSENASGRGQTGSGSKGWNGTGSGQSMSAPRFNPQASGLSARGVPAQEVHILTQVTQNRGEKELDYPGSLGVHMESPTPYAQPRSSYSTSPRQPTFLPHAYSAHASDGSSLRGPQAV